MKITVFTSNQPRRISLINRLAEVGDMTLAVMEYTTVFPGLVKVFSTRPKSCRNIFQMLLLPRRSFLAISISHDQTSDRYRLK